MKLLHVVQIVLSVLLLVAVRQLPGQSPTGQVVIDSLYSPSLENEFGEPATRALSVYLPPGYAESEGSYPVIYFLHGFTGNNVMPPSMVEALDYAIEHRGVRPFILVLPDCSTRIGGSFYTNSIFGQWEDFLAEDLVEYIDGNYRTLTNRMSRGITGHSMGGYGALKLAMRHPDMYSSVYAISPGALTIVGEYGPNSDTYRELAAAKDMEDLDRTYFARVIVAFGQAWSPNPDNPPFYADIPFTYADGETTVDEEVLEKWYDELPLHMIDDHLEALQSLTAIKLDWGRNAGTRFTRQCEMFSQRLENVGVEHYAEEYIGTHVSDIYTPRGRISEEVLPFFDTFLHFEPQEN